ncbi:hypothetical protein UXU46_06940 [Campylobacter jejuni]
MQSNKTLGEKLKDSIDLADKEAIKQSVGFVFLWLIRFFNLKGELMTEEKENIVNFKIKIIHEENIELGIMANSLLSFQKLMDSFISKEHGITQSKIFLEKVETGSDIYSLVFEIAGEVLPIIAPIQALNEFIELIISFKNIKSKSIEEIEENPHFTKYNANNLKNIFAPVTINQNTFLSIIKVKNF